MLLKTYSHHLAISIPLLLSCYLFADTNDPAVVGTVTKSVDQDTVLPLSADDFTKLFNKYTNTSLIMIQILSLPDYGILKLKELAVALKQKIKVQDLDMLRFEPLAGWYGLVNFSWSGSDGSSYLEQVAHMVISILKTPLSYCSEHSFTCYWLPTLTVMASTLFGALLYMAHRYNVGNRVVPIVPAPLQGAELKV